MNAIARVVTGWALCLVCNFHLVAAPGAPEIISVSPPPGEITALTNITIRFSESVTGVGIFDFLLNGIPSASRVTGSGDVYTFEFDQQPPYGVIAITWDPAHTIFDTDSPAQRFDENDPSSRWQYNLVDQIAPAIAVLTPAAGVTVRSLGQIEVNFTEAVSGIDAADLLINGAAASGMAVAAPGQYLFTFAQPPDGLVQVAWAAGHGIRDFANNPFPGGSWTYTLDPDFGLANIRINEFLAANLSGLVDEDSPPEPQDWIEIWNYGTNTVNLAGYSLTDDAEDPGKWTFPSTNLGPGQFLVVFASEKNRKTVANPAHRLHTNFRLSSNGEYLALFNAELPRIAISQFAPKIPEQRNDFSYGYDSTNALKYFAVPTPGAPNGASAITGVLPPPHFNVERGLFETPFTLTISSQASGASILYTTDGTEPSQVTTNTLTYSEPLAISNITTLRAAAFKDGMLPSATVTHTYLFLDQVVSQPVRPVGFPTNWGANGSFAGGLIPADYEMDVDPLRVDPNNTNSPVDAAKLQRLKEGLRELPIVSVVMKLEDIFSTNGIYQRSAVETGTPGNKPENKKACSIEMILPDGTTAFATTCGIDLHGNASRNPVKNPKHGFKLSFRGDFGPPNLDYRLFEDSPVEEFDDLLLRADFNSSWRHWSDNPNEGLGGLQRTRATRTRDAWMKTSMRDMGGLASHNRFVHFYMNGLYWGTYDFSEDATEAFAKTALGGTEADYDIVDQGVLKNGTLNTYNAMVGLPAATTLAQYEQYHQYLSVPDYADYMLLHFYMGHQDWATTATKNWSAIRKRVAGPEGTFRYVPWDGECILLNENVNRVTVAGANFPSGLHGDLDDSPEYRLLFADRVHRHMIAPGAALTPGASIARWQKLERIMDKPIVAESARWGDYRRDVHRHDPNASPAPYGFQLYTRENHWVPENARMLTYFTNRGGTVLGQLRAVGLYPSNDPPVFNQQGGLAARGFNLTMTATNPIYYTLDGTDPRAYGTGAVSAQATPYIGPVTLTNSVIVKARALFGTNWSALNEATFAVNALSSPLRITEIMYNPIGGDSYEYIEIQNVGSAAINIGLFSLNGVTYVFPPNTFLGAGQILVLGSDENPVNWTNRYPGVLAFGRFNGSLANGGEKLGIEDPQGHLVYSVDYDDENGWPTAADGLGYSLQIVDVFGDPDDPANWRASDAPDGTPGTPSTSPSPGPIVINEIMAENLTAVANSGTYPDWIEIRNTGGSPVNLAGWSLTDDGNPRKFVFPSVSVPGNGYLVVWCDSTTNTTPGIHTGFALGRNGESVFLYNASTVRVDSVTVGLQLADYSVGRVTNTWRLTTPTPNGPNVAATLASSTNLVINEWLADAVPGGADWVELYNRSTTPVALNGLYLGNGSAIFQLTSLSFVPARGFVQLFADELSGPDRLDFKLSASGGTIVLYDEAGHERDRVNYGAQAQGVSQGRLPNGSATIVSFPASPSPGASNYVVTYTGPRLNEVMAVNSSAVTNSAGRTADWIELRNTNATSFDLSGMRLTTDPRNPTQWTFPPGSSIPGNGYLVVWFDDELPASTTADPLLNTGVAIDGESGEVHLLNSGNQLVDSVVFGFQVRNLSIGLNGAGWTLLANSTPGAANSASATLGSPATLRINEWMADPDSGNDWFELYNGGAQPVALHGVYVTDTLSIPGSTLAPLSPLSFIGANGFVKIIADGDPGDGRDHVTFNLDALGEALRVYTPALGPIDTIYFGAQETGVSEGRLPDGSTGIVRFPSTPTPAESNFLPLPNAVIHEVLAHSADPLEDAVEIHNLNTVAANVSGWFLSDQAWNLKKYRIPAGTVINPLAYKVIYQDQLTGGAGALVPFTLDSARGGSLYLSAADGAGNLTGFRSAVRFGASANGVSFGRYLTTTGSDFPPLWRRTFGVDNPSSVAEFRTGAGASNAPPRIGPVVLNELMFHPPDMGTNDNVVDEYIELHNVTTNTVTLFDPAHTTNTWRIRGGIDFEFPSGASLGSRAFALVVSFNPVTDGATLNAFRATYGIPAAVPIFGPYRGKLDNGGEEVALLQPDVPLSSGPGAGFVPYLLIDRVGYDDQSPWPVTADGGGASLQRSRPSEYGNDPVNWKGEGPTPGRPNVAGSTYTDADGDGISDAWESTNGLNPSNRSDADADFDSDGESNAQEYWAGTDPFNPSSYLAAPTITSHPQSATGVAGFDVTFSVSAAGSGPLAYKWRHNGRDIPGAGGQTLFLQAVQVSQSGQYEAVVINSRGYAISRAAILTVAQPPRFTQHPQGQTILNSNNVTFTVAAVGTGPLRFQWQLNGVNIPGATNSSYTVTNAQIHHSGNYRATVTDDVATIPSNPAVLEVRMRPIFVIQPVSQNLVLGGTLSLSVRVQGSVPLGFRWRRNGVNYTNIVLYDTNCTLVIPDVQVSHAGSYNVVVTNAAQTAGILSSSATVTVLAITNQPANQIAYPGENITFAVRAVGANPLRYQWRFNEDDIAGATSSNLVLNSVQSSHVGNYSAVVSDVAGSVTSTTAQLALTGGLQLQIVRGGNVVLAFDALANKTYQIQYRDTLGGTNVWQALPTIAAGPARQVNITNSPSGNTRFYRLRTPAGP